MLPKSHFYLLCIISKILFVRRSFPDEKFAKYLHATTNSCLKLLLG